MKSLLTIMILKEGSQFVAVGLEQFLAAQGPSVEEALEAFADLLRADKAVRAYENAVAAVSAPEEYYHALPVYSPEK